MIFPLLHSLGVHVSQLSCVSTLFSLPNKRAGCTKESRNEWKPLLPRDERHERFSDSIWQVLDELPFISKKRKTDRGNSRWNASTALLSSPLSCWRTLHLKETKGYGKLQLQKRRLIRRRPTRRWKKCNPVRKKKRQLKTESYFLSNFSYFMASSRVFILFPSLMASTNLPEPINNNKKTKERKEKVGLAYNPSYT